MRSNGTEVFAIMITLNTNSVAAKAAFDMSSEAAKQFATFISRIAIQQMICYALECTN